MSINLIESNEQFSSAVEQNRSFFLLKHSLTCPISGEAKEQYEAFAKNSETPLYILHVQEARTLSNEIAEKFEVKHESPQALLFESEKVVWNASHWDITEKSLTEIEQKYVSATEPK